MEFTEHEIFQKDAQKCMQCTRNILLPHEYERSFIACEYNVIKRKNELSKFSWKKSTLHQPITKC